MCFKVVQTVEEGIQAAKEFILRGENSCTALRLVRRPDGAMFVNQNDHPIMSDFKYLAVIQDARRHGRGIIVHSRINKESFDDCDMRCALCSCDLSCVRHKQSI